MMREKFPYAIECVQTDNGFEFTNEMGNSKKKPPTLFEKTLEQLGIKHKKSRPFTPRHNGKVERSHRKTTRNSRLLIVSILLTILQNSLPSVKGSIIISPCVRSTGSLLAISFFLFLLCNLSLTNLQSPSIRQASAT